MISLNHNLFSCFKKRIKLLIFQNIELMIELKKIITPFNPKNNSLTFKILRISEHFLLIIQ